jgi:hypothetical protein
MYIRRSNCLALSSSLETLAMLILHSKPFVKAILIDIP